MELDDETDDSAPHWMVTYGDLMSLLLTFFVLLVSMSEIKQNDKYQGVADSIHRHFGEHFWPASSQSETKPRNPSLAAVALAGQARRQELLASTTLAPESQAASPPLRLLRPGMRTAVGAVVAFAENRTDLSEANKNELRSLAPLLHGKPQKIEIRSHAPQNRTSLTADPSQTWKRGYERAENTMRFLVDDLRLNADRIGISLASPNEPLASGLDSAFSQQNAKVEVFLREEVMPRTAP